MWCEKKVHLQSSESFSNAKNSLPKKLQIPITPYPRETNGYIIQLDYILTPQESSASLVIPSVYQRVKKSALNNF